MFITATNNMVILLLLSMWWLCSNWSMSWRSVQVC